MDFISGNGKRPIFMPSVVNWSELAFEAIWRQDIVVQCKLHVKSGNTHETQPQPTPCHLLTALRSICTAIPNPLVYSHLLYRHECFTGKYTTRKIHKNYILDPSGLFSIISHVSLSMA